MKVLIIYSTNTGNTYLAAQVIKDMLQKDHDVTFKSSADVELTVLNNHEAIIIGSSSWDWKGKEGYPLHSMMDLLEKLKDNTFESKKFAVFGCGDKDFRVFCGAVNHMENFIKERGGHFITEPLKLDKFYVDIIRKIELTKTWAKELDQALNS